MATRRPSSKARLHILITAGPTREHFDSVRFISNPSSGKMGYAIAEAAVATGHAVTLISGPVELAPPPGVDLRRVVSAREMADAAKKAFKTADAAIFTAAVCDYRPARRATRKLAKSATGRSLALIPTVDIAATLGKEKGERITIAFAMEDHDGRAHAERKLHRKRADAIVLNHPSTAGCDSATVEFLQAGAEWETWPRGTKKAVAKRIIQTLERLHAERHGDKGSSDLRTI